MSGLMLSPSLPYDVLLDIFGHLDPGGADDGSISSVARRDNQRALSQVARTCSALSEIALDVLWRNLNDLGHLLQVLSSFKHRSAVRSCGQQGRNHLNTAVDDNTGEWMLFGDIHPLEWSRFQQYACRVRVLSSLGPNLLSLPSLQLLWLLNEAQPLLPRVEKLEYIQWRGSDPSLLFLISPSESILTLHIDATRPGFWHKLQSREPNAALSIVLDRTSFRASPNISLGLAVEQVPDVRCNRLRRVALQSLEPFIDSTLLRGLAMVPDLVDLILTVHDEDEPITAVYLFQSLRRMTLQGRATRLTQFIEMGVIMAPQLQSLDLVVEWYADRTPEQYRCCLAAVCAQYDGSLRELRLTNERRPKSMDIQVPEQPMENAIEALFALHRLEILHLFFPPRWGLTISVRLVHRMVTSWPHLTKFMTTTYRSSILVSASALTEFATHCPRLRKLGLPPIDLQSLPDSKWDNWTLSHGLRHLELGNDIHGLNAKLLDAAQLAHFLHRTFPRLDLDSSVFHTTCRAGYNTYSPDLLVALRSLQVPGLKIL